MVTDENNYFSYSNSTLGVAETHEAFSPFDDGDSKNQIWDSNGNWDLTINDIPSVTGKLRRASARQADLNNLIQAVTRSKSSTFTSRKDLCELNSLALGIKRKRGFALQKGKQLLHSCISQLLGNKPRGLERIHGFRMKPDQGQEALGGNNVL